LFPCNLHSSFRRKPESSLINDILDPGFRRGNEYREPSLLHSFKPVPKVAGILTRSRALRSLIIYPRLGFDPFLVGVFYFQDFAYGVGTFDNLGVGVSSGEHKVQEGRFLVNDL
jgi:hypothetical protein